MKITEGNPLFYGADGHEEHVWFCDCTELTHAMRATWDEDDPEWRYLEFHSVIRPNTWKQRIEWAWKAIRGKDTYGSEIILHPEVVRSLKAFLEQRIQ